MGYLRRHAPGPAEVNEGPHHFLADLLYEAFGWPAGRDSQRTWKVHIDHLAKRVLEVVRPDPGCQVLAAVNVRYCHHIRHVLQKHREVRVIRYIEL